MKNDLERDEFGMEDVEDYFSESSVEASNHESSISQILMASADGAKEKLNSRPPTSKQTGDEFPLQPKQLDVPKSRAAGGPGSATNRERANGVRTNGSRNPFLSYLRETGSDTFAVSPSRSKIVTGVLHDSMESMDISKTSPRAPKSPISLQRRSIFGRSPHQTHINSPARRLSSSVTPRIKGQKSAGRGGIVSAMMPTSMLADSEEDDANTGQEQSMEVDQDAAMEDSAMEIDESQNVIDVPDNNDEDDEEEEDEPVLERTPVKPIYPSRGETKYTTKFGDKPLFSFDDANDSEEEVVRLSSAAVATPPAKAQRSRPKRPEIKKALPKKQVQSPPPRHVEEEEEIIQVSEPPSPEPVQKEPEPTKPAKRVSKSSRIPSFKNSAPPVHDSDGSEELDSGMRRSKRIKVAPLEFWRNERIVYSLEKPERPSIKTIVHRDKGAEEEEAAVKREIAAKRAHQAAERRRKAAKRTKAKDSDDELNELDEKVIKEQRKEGTLVEKSFLEGSVFKYPAEPSEDGNTNEREDQPIAWGHEIKLRNVVGGTHKVASLFDREARFAAGGVLALSAKGSKPTKPSKQNHYFFFVTAGAVKVDISDVVFTVTKGGSFVVPRGNYYSITNILDKEAKMFFVQCTDTLSNKERGLSTSSSRNRTSMSGAPAPE